MDKNQPTGAQKDLLIAALKAVEPLGLRFRILHLEVPTDDHFVDAVVQLRFGGLDLRYEAEVKRGLRPATLGALIHQFRARTANPLLVADHVTPPIADTLRKGEVEFIDAAGNAFLNRPPLLVFVKGQRPTGERMHRTRGRAFQATGLQVLFALLARPDLIDRPYRRIAAAAGVAHGTVGWVMAELPRLGYVVKAGGRRRLVNGDRLLGQWLEAYARTLRPKLLLKRFRGKLEDIDPHHVMGHEDLLLGGEFAAARLTHHLRPGTATFYTRDLNAKVVLDLALRADDDGNIDFRRRFWNFPAEHQELTPTLLVYADLLAMGDPRCLEAAQLLRGQLLDRLI